MTDNDLAVFFYGLFMDASVLASKGIEPSQSTIGFVDGYRLRIRKRATLVPEPAHRAYGVLMTIGRHEATALYSDPSVADYVAQPVCVTLPSGVTRPAICYNLPPGALGDANSASAASAYAASLLRLATDLGFPDEYLDTIRAQTVPS